MAFSNKYRLRLSTKALCGALILIYNALRQCNSPNLEIHVLELFRTATEISEIMYMYARDSKRTPKEVLRFHNLTYQHGKLCMDLFAQRSTKNPVFGRYFHPITCHSPLLLRVICLRSVNTEEQERMFGQAKQITKSTSCLRPNHVITKIITRVHAEAKAESNTLKFQEGEIHNLAQVLGPASNTVIPQVWIDTNPTLHQAHLERISDFLLPGRGVWWQHTPGGIEFLDGDHSPSQHPEGPQMHHFRSISLPDIDMYMYLHSKWEECCYGHVRLPATYIRQYHSDGSLSTITTSDVQVTPQPTSHAQLTAQPTSHPQLTAQPTSHPQLTAQPTSHPQLTAQPTSHAQLSPQPTSHEQLTAQPTSHAQLTAQPTSHAQLSPAYESCATHSPAYQSCATQPSLRVMRNSQPSLPVMRNSQPSLRVMRNSQPSLRVMRNSQPSLRVMRNSQPSLRESLPSLRGLHK